MNYDIRLDFPDDRGSLYTIDDINDELSIIGTKVNLLDLTDVPPDIRTLLNKTVLSDEEIEMIMNQFLMPMDKLLDVIHDAGRKPHVDGGGKLSTTVTNFGYSYPQLYIAEDGVDYSRFDKLHINVSDDGTGVDEIIQFISGSELVMHQLMPDNQVFKVHFSCDRNNGWLVTYDGHNPHIGSLTSSSIGAKVVVQVIGPAEWEMKYL